jgi:2'-5' RNA ligase
MGNEARLFLAIWPNAKLASDFHRLAEDIHPHSGGRRMPIESMHLTLAFLGATPRERIVPLCNALSGVRFKAFSIALDRFGYWEPGIVWLGGAVPSALEQLAADVREVMSALDIRFDRKRFKPHVTLLRNARRAPLGEPSMPLQWAATGFRLIESVSDSAGSSYLILADFPADP